MVSGSINFFFASIEIITFSLIGFQTYAVLTHFFISFTYIFFKIIIHDFKKFLFDHFNFAFILYIHISFCLEFCNVEILICKNMLYNPFHSSFNVLVFTVERRNHRFRHSIQTQNKLVALLISLDRLGLDTVEHVQVDFT